MIKKTIVQICSIPERVESLQKTVESIINQVDYMFVGLNSYSGIPNFLKHRARLCVAELDNKLTDGAKCYDIEHREGYVLLLDDDIQVPPTYVQDMISAVDKYKCIITLHGKVYKKPFKDFYTLEKNYRCLGNCPEGGVVDVGGTGVMAWHTDFFKLAYEDIKLPNMCDIWVSKRAYEQNVKIRVIPHTDRYLIHTSHSENIFKTENAKKFVKQTEILKSFIQ